MGNRDFWAAARGFGRICAVSGGWVVPRRVASQWLAEGRGGSAAGDASIHSAMTMRGVVVMAACSVLSACAPESASRTGGTAIAGRQRPAAAAGPEAPAAGARPLVMGETFTVNSRMMGEARTINVFVPTVYGEKIDAPMPVLYMLDGGMDEDFLHIAGLVQILVSGGGMRPYMLVGIQNTSRRRDMTGPTQVESDKKIAPVVGGSAAFRRFIREELMPEVRARYRTTEESAVVGESLAGLFVVETFFLEPDLFGTYIAIDPSLWWADGELVRSADARLAAWAGGRKSVYLAHSDEPTIAKFTEQLAGAFAARSPRSIEFRSVAMPAEGHQSIYHPAALAAFRAVFAPPAKPAL